jgi:radical SAM protein with 4Fe4S-binding SPASM domain
MKSFRFKEGVYLVKGAQRGAILDTNQGNVYSINSAGTAALSGALSNEPYWQRLVGLELAEECDQPCPLPNLPRLPIFNLGFVWFEIVTSDCNECCVHCYADSMPARYRRSQSLMVGPEAQAERSLSYAEWCLLIQEGHDLGCRECQFIGGEPFLYRDQKHTVLDLAQCAREAGYETIEIFTNATLLTEAKIDRLKELGIKIAVSLYSDDPAIHDSITRTPGSHGKTMQSLRWLQAAGVPTRIGFVAMSKNEHTIESTIALIESLGIPGSHPDPLRPGGRAQDAVLLPSARTLVNYGLTLSPNFGVDLRTLAHYVSGHSCLAGKLAITETGDALPCIFSRNQILGNVREGGGIASVVSAPSTQAIWKSTKDDVLICQDCEYRYVCFDCRPLSEAAAEGRVDFLHAPYPRCTYNPYTGRWGEGLWRMTDEGPIYDRTYEEIIAGAARMDSVAVVHEGVS